MASPYRDGFTSGLGCPRCEETLPPGDITSCTKECGTWVSALAAKFALDEREYVENRVTRWWRIRAPCPVCKKQMKLRGLDEVLFQGCDAHGYFIDADTTSKTSLSEGDRITNALRQVETYRTNLRTAEAQSGERATNVSARATASSSPTADAEEREAAERAERKRRKEAKRAAARERYAKLVADALTGGKPEALVDELMRLDDAIQQLASRVTDLER